MGLKTIIFDFGGVILDIDPQLTINHFEKLGMEDSSKFLEEKFINNVIKKFEKGKYKFDDVVNNATFTFDKSDPTKIYTSVKSVDDWVEITKIHTDNKTFDGKFSLTCQNAAGDAKVITGNWLNLKKK